MRRSTIILAVLAFVAGWHVAQGPALAPTSQPDAKASAPATQPNANQRAAGMALFSVQAAPLTNAQREQVVAFLKTERPKVAQALAQTRTQDADKYDLMLERVGRTTLYLIELKATNPELYGVYVEEMNVNDEISETVATLRKTDDPARRSAVVDQLRDQLGKQFDLGQQRQELMVTQFKGKVESLERLLKTRQANRDKIIQQMLDTMVNGQVRTGVNVHQAAEPTGLNTGAATSRPD